MRQSLQHYCIDYEVIRKQNVDNHEKGRTEIRYVTENYDRQQVNPCRYRVVSERPRTTTRKTLSNMRSSSDLVKHRKERCNQERNINAWWPAMWKTSEGKENKRMIIISNSRNRSELTSKLRAIFKLILYINYIYNSVWLHTHTHTHTYIYIYIYIYILHNLVPRLSKEEFLLDIIQYSGLYITMDKRGEWRERVREIRARSTWRWWYIV